MVKERSTTYAGRTVSSPFDAEKLFREFIGEADREIFCILCLNTKNEPTNFSIISIGSLNSSIVHPREVFKCALLASANSIVLCHNHPSGVAEPSTEDLVTTKRLVDAGNIIGIKVIDHIILGDEQMVSLKERGIV